MPHIDEGRLHAWLDGNLGPDSGPEGAALDRHLDSCAECHARLEEARRQKERASEALSSTDLPVADAPSFETLLAAARRDDPGRDTGEPADPVGPPSEPGRASGRAGRRIPRIGLAWAASIAVAISAGVIARELSDRTGVDLPAALELERDALLEERSRTAEPQRAETAESGARSSPRASATEKADPAGARSLVVPADPSEGRVEALAEARADDEATADLGRMPGENGAVGCWRNVTEEPAPGAPAWMRLAEAPAGAGPAGSLKIETGSGEQPVEPYGASWNLLGPDSVEIRLPPALLRLAVGGDQMRGTAMSEESAPAAAKESQAVTFRRVACPQP